MMLSLLGLVVAASFWSSFAITTRGRARAAAREAVGRLAREVALVRAPLDMATAALKKEAQSYANQQRTTRLATIPVDSLKDVGAPGVRWTALRDGGVHTLADLAARSKEQLLMIPGVGEGTADSVLSAVRTVRDRILSEPVSLPTPDTLDDAGERLVRRTATMLRTREALAGTVAALEQKHRTLSAQLGPVLEESSFFRWWKNSQVQRAAITHDAQHIVKEAESDELTKLVQEAHERCATLLSTPQLGQRELAEDFRSRYADYRATIEAAFEGVSATPVSDREHIEGKLPEGIAQQTEGLTLRSEGLKVALRRYQEFGAKYLVVQQKTILGDEMGLGKTIQALAAMVHLSTTEDVSRFLVVAPASILGNWLREIRSRTSLPDYLMHGPQRHKELLAWVERGGVAVTSYETFRTDDIDGALARRRLMIDLLIVDEAHYTKNPGASRSRAVKEIVPLSRRVCFMTGTPLENRIQEFHNLIGLLNPEVAAKLKLINYGLLRAGVERQKFQEAVAPVYLRRNQEDVLRELPEKIEKEEWVDLTPDDKEAYKAAVRAKNMMAMRRTATLGKGDGQSAKLSRLDELLDEYREAEQKVLVFSFFLDVLEAVRQLAEASAVITGAASPAERMGIVDEFQKAPGFRVLPAQIQAGGVGLNLQAASVVILMEPQWKATAEDQAIARAHRMGQTRRVVVHRLLARNAVDERLLEVLRGKKEIFETYARDSLVKEASTEATEGQVANTIIEAELERLRREEGKEEKSVE